MFTPYMINREASKVLDAMLETNANWSKLKSENWRIFFVDQTRGRCYHSGKVITIPTWIIKNKKGMSYLRHYVNHEIGHALVGSGHSHDSTWLYKVMEICDCGMCLEREMKYKSQVVNRAIAAGRLS